MQSTSFGSHLHCRPSPRSEDHIRHQPCPLAASTKGLPLTFPSRVSIMPRELMRLELSHHLPLVHASFRINASPMPLTVAVPPGWVYVHKGRMCSPGAPDHSGGGALFVPESQRVGRDTAMGFDLHPIRPRTTRIATKGTQRVARAEFGSVRGTWSWKSDLSVGLSDMVSRLGGMLWICAT